MALTLVINDPMQSLKYELDGGGGGGVVVVVGGGGGGG
jgi:hypothetical protein